MEQYISKSALVAEIKRRRESNAKERYFGRLVEDNYFLDFLDTLEAKEVDLVIYTIIAECCDWLAMTTNLSHDEIEGCRNLMLTVKEEQLKAQKGE